MLHLPLVIGALLGLQCMHKCISDDCNDVKVKLPKCDSIPESSSQYCYRKLLNISFCYFLVYCIKIFSRKWNVQGPSIQVTHLQVLECVFVGMGIW